MGQRAPCPTNEQKDEKITGTSAYIFPIATYFESVKQGN